jgi:hypothetical protein
MEIFFYLDRDFSRVWKVSFQNETIETYSGFSQYRSYTLDAEGIWASELQDDITSVIDPAIRNKANRIMKMYPNPTSGVFFIDLHTTSGLKARVELYTGQGKLVFVNEYPNQSTAVINLSNNTKGVYFVKVIDNIGIRFDYLSLE